MNEPAVMEQGTEAKHRLPMLAAICLGAFLSHFTAGVVNVSLPQLMDELHSDLDTVQWMSTGYLLVIASLLPVMGKMGDRYGHRAVHNWGYACFTLSTLLAAFAADVYTLLALRSAQAVGAAMFQATNMAIIAHQYPPERRGNALGIVSSAVALGGMTGPIAGGIVSEWLSWRWLFLVHVPVAVIATGLALRYIPARPRKPAPVSFDGIGAILFVAAIGAVIYGLSRGNASGWSSVEIVAVFAAGVMALLLFLLREFRGTDPFLPLKALRDPAVALGLTINCASFALANAVLVAMPLYLSDAAGHSPSETGYMMTAYPLLLAACGPIAGRWADRAGSRPFMLAGLGAMGGGLAVLAVFLGRLPLAGIMAVLALIGAGMGFVASPTNRFVMGRAPLRHSGSIGGLIALTRNLGMVVGAALGLGLLNGEAGASAELGAIRLLFAVNAAIGVLCAAVLIIYAVGRRSAGAAAAREKGASR
ncbi:DHA2 family efflux MFS transporter permease subunit [Paenibacillus arenilitoris]|uniref:DHA2 family efflux MFS transporter permease subunit n=1 Tax=Paenibacillus arenilitoris TaxID=2772299 RepID=A0A927CLE7_9BACL|nr:DHA2 family efflux MFS transporter permease subunit [Paenibacillus arenilitoris]MBD2869352.1 DHA2 family efflux MFS transporter permease subunit [Paenibacillus arenilitoris]